MPFRDANIDELLESYDIDHDPLLQEEFTPVHDRLWHVIEGYADNVNEYGTVMSAHLQRTSAIGQAFLTQELGFSEKAGKNFYDANLFHDLGKCHPCYDPIIWQTPHRPTQDERSQKRHHTQLGVEYLDLSLTHSSEDLQKHAHIRVIESLQQHHHERMDGSGYEGKYGDSLGQAIKMICIIDAYDGDMIHRPHQPSQRTPAEALGRMKTGEKYQGAFDAEMLDRFIDFTLKSA